MLHSPDLPSTPYLKPEKPEKLEPGRDPIALTHAGLLSWKDIYSVKTRKLYNAHSVTLDHLIWALAGFVPEDWLHI